MLDLNTIWADFPVLQTERFTLRAPAAADAPAIFRMLSDPLVTRYFGSRPMRDPGEAAERIERQTAAFAERRGIRWMIVDRASESPIGSGGFWRLIPEHNRAEIGYELDPAWWGKGAMPEALAAALEYGFAVMGLHSVEANIHPDNVGSRRVLEKLGFVQEGYFRENYYDVIEQCFTDSAIYSLLRRDWQQRRA